MATDMPSATDLSAAAEAPPDRGARTFATPREALEDLTGVVLRTPALASVYLRGRLDPRLRERVMVAVSRVNACRGCTLAHERWALRTGVADEELNAIGLGDLAALDDRSRAAIVYATALAEARFREPVPADLAADVGNRLTTPEQAAVDAVARAMSLANLSASTAESVVRRLRSRIER